MVFSISVLSCPDAICCIGRRWQDDWGFLRDSPQIDERIGLFVAQEVVNVDYKRLRRVNVHVVAVLRAFQVRIWVYERFWPDVGFGLDDNFLLAFRRKESAETGCTEEDVEYGSDCCQFENCPPSERLWHDGWWLLLSGSCGSEFGDLEWWKARPGGDGDDVHLDTLTQCINLHQHTCCEKPKSKATFSSESLRNPNCAKWTRVPRDCKTPFRRRRFIGVRKHCLSTIFRLSANVTPTLVQRIRRLVCCQRCHIRSQAFVWSKERHADDP